MLIEEIRVQGYKSLVDATLHVRPLTLLAGTNSSGKSSIMQPLLLIKQTMEAPYQPAGALVLSGAHVQAETAGELVSKVKEDILGFSINVIGNHPYYDETVANAVNLIYTIKKHDFELSLQETTGVLEKERKTIIKPDTTWLEYNEQLDEHYKLKIPSGASGKAELVNGLLQFTIQGAGRYPGAIFRTTLDFEKALICLMHIPGLRNKPERSYPATLFKDKIRGTFDLYAAGTISQWQQENNTKALAQLNDSLQRLGLTNSVTAKVKNANEVELSVNRLPSTSKTKPRKADMVNIADVGIGVSQVLPILVALIAAQEGQIVYVEQPELHLHPRAQVAMGELLAEAANRGVRVIVETHSSLLLLTVQTLVAEGKIKPGDVGLHWFERDAKGATTVRYEQPDEDGAYGEWPEDFGDVELNAQRNYLDAVTRRQPKRSHTA
jgi:predicted ATPase